MRLTRWLFGSREPDLNELLARTDATITVRRANGDEIEIVPLGAQRQKPQGGGPGPQRQNGDGRPNGAGDQPHHRSLFQGR